MRYLLLIGFIMVGGIFFSQVAPLIQTEWNQGCYYNDSCPVNTAGQCGKVYTGCYATAIAQIMNYHSWPNTGSGYYSYAPTGYPIQSVNYDSAHYDWSVMPSSVSSPNAEVAKIMYHIGVSNDMIYSSTSSNSFFGSIPIKKHFSYSIKAKSIGVLFMSSQSWEDSIKASIDRGYPVFAKSSSVNHFFIIDGYRYNPSIEFHFNFGWSGVYDGYYDLFNTITPIGNITPKNAIINIHPRTSIEVYHNTNGDTIDISYNGGAKSYELASSSNWTVSYVDNWITPDSVSGKKGWFNYSSGAKCTVSSNIGLKRLGKIIYTDGVTSDTLYVLQDANPTVSIYENNKDELNIYPNPSKGFIEIKGVSVSDEIRILTVEGKLIKTLPYTNDFFDISFLDKGIYMIEVLKKDNVFNKIKFIKQ